MGTALKAVGMLLGLVFVTGVTVQAGAAAGLDPAVAVWLAAIAVAYLIYRVAG
jgi:hypothetical protein